MCGVLAIIAPQGHRVHIKRAVESLNRQQHRGPDNYGFVSEEDGRIFLGHRLLSIRADISNAQQPLYSSNKRHIVSYNGEIYNGRELFCSTRANIEIPQCDTEILLRGIEENGLRKTVKAIDGIFSFVHYDKSEKRLTAARDRVGIKPLYVYVSREGFVVYSSDIKSIQHFFTDEMKLNTDVIDEYLAYKYVIPPETLWKDVKLVMPGCLDICNLNHQYTSRRTEKYVQLEDECLSTHSLPALLDSAIESQLIANVPVGVQLSGGVDSTLIYEGYIARRHGLSFSVTFNDAACSEEEWINKVLDRNSTKILAHNEIFLTKEEFNSLMDSCTYHMESPINHPHSIAIMRLSQCASSTVKVLLSGEGADELFGGYVWQQPNNSTLHYWQRTQFLGSQERKLLEMHTNFKSEHADQRRRSLFDKLKGDNRILTYELSTHLHELLLRQDKMTMSASVEGRVPFLANDLIGYSYAIRDSGRYNSECPKHQLKDILRSYGYGHKFVDRKKIGFRIPFDEWVTDSINSRIKKLVQDPDAIDIFGNSLLRELQIAASYRSGFSQAVKLLWVIENMLRFQQIFSLSS